VPNGTSSREPTTSSSQRCCSRGKGRPKREIALANLPEFAINMGPARREPGQLFRCVSQGVPMPSTASRFAGPNATGSAKSGPKTAPCRSHRRSALQVCLRAQRRPAGQHASPRSKPPDDTSRAQDRGGRALAPLRPVRPTGPALPSGPEGPRRKSTRRSPLAASGPLDAMGREGMRRLPPFSSVSPPPENWLAPARSLPGSSNASLSLRAHNRARPHRPRFASPSLQ
jgi:hypothetical protein